MNSSEKHSRARLLCVDADVRVETADTHTHTLSQEAHAINKVIADCQETLRRLRTQHIPLKLCHPKPPRAKPSQ